MESLIVDLDKYRVASWEWLVAVRALTVAMWLLVAYRRNEPHPLGLLIRIGAVGLVLVLLVDSIGVSSSREALSWGALGRDLPLMLIAYALSAAARIRRHR